MKEDRIAKGKKGEELAVLALSSAGYAILERNYRTRDGEIDIIAAKDDCLYFVEVRSKSGAGFGSAAESITLAKRQKIARAAEKYLQEKAGDPKCGFLFVAVDLKSAKTEIIADMLL